MASVEINLRTSKTYNLLIGSIASSENTNILHFNSAKLLLFTSICKILFMSIDIIVLPSLSGTVTLTMPLTLLLILLLLLQT